VFKLGVGNDLGIYSKWYAYGVKGQGHRVDKSILHTRTTVHRHSLGGIISRQCGIELYECLLVCNADWTLSLSGNTLASINVVALHRAGLVLGWVTIVYHLCISSSCPALLSLAIPPQVGSMSTGDGLSHRYGRNGEFCITVGLLPALLAYGPSRFKLLAAMGPAIRPTWFIC